VERLARDGHRIGLVHARPAVDRQGATQLAGPGQVSGQIRHVCGWNDIALFIFRHGQQPVHVIDLLFGHADGVRNVRLGFAAQVNVAHVGVHRRQPLQHTGDHVGVTGGERLGQVLDRDAQRVQRAEQVAQVLPVVPVAADRVDHRRQRRDVPDHRHGPVFRVQGKRHPVGVDQRVHRRPLGGVDPLIGDALGPRPGDHGRVVGVQQDSALSLVELRVVVHRRRLGYPIDVVEHQPEVAQPSHTRFRAHRGHPDLDARITQSALLGLAGLVVEIHLLVRTSGHTHPPAAAAVLIDEHDSVLGALVHRARWARRHAGRVQAMLADPRQIEDEGVFELELDLVR
jgi:hypothetical protein